MTATFRLVRVFSCHTRNSNPVGTTDTRFSTGCGVVGSSMHIFAGTGTSHGRSQKQGKHAQQRLNSLIAMTSLRERSTGVCAKLRPKIPLCSSSWKLICPLAKEMEDAAVWGGDTIGMMVGISYKWWLYVLKVPLLLCILQ